MTGLYRSGSVGAVKGRTLAAAAALGFVPAPMHVQYVQGNYPGYGADQNFAAGTDVANGVVYYQSQLTPFVRGHETGHVFDAQVLTDGDRRAFQRIMQAPSGAWDQGTGTGPGMHSPKEWFADYYGAAATHVDPSREGVSAYAQIGPVRLKRFEQALDRLGRRQHLKPYGS